MRLNDALPLGNGRQRQEHIAGCLRRGRHEDIEGDYELHRIVDGAHPAFRFRRSAGEQIIAREETHFYRIRIPGLHGTQR